MKQIHVDPEKLREFSRVLRDFSTHVDTSLRNLNGQMGRLHGSWRDKEFDRFAQHLRRTLTRLQSFASETARVVPELERDADAIFEYQTTRLND